MAYLCGKCGMAIGFTTSGDLQLGGSFNVSVLAFVLRSSL